MAKVKGVVFKPRLDFVKRRGSPEEEKLILESLSEGLRKEIKQHIIVSQWYPFEYYLELNQAIVKVLGHGDILILHEVGRFSADDALHGIYKLFFKVGSPEVIIRAATLAWKQYFQNGDLKLEREGDKHIRVLFTKVEILSREHFVSVQGWIQRVMELSGCTEVSVKIEKFTLELVTMDVSWK